jgi:D-alanine-D-alanine ligase
MTKVVVLAGGISDEREVSLRSGAAVTAALKEVGYVVSQLDPGSPTEDYETEIQSSDVVFPALHGSNGEDGMTQKWLEDRLVAYVGCDSIVSALCFDKWHYKTVLLENGVATPPGELVSRESFGISKLAQHPFVLKPYDGGSSVDTIIARDPTGYDQAAIDAAFERHPRMLLEELVIGREITVGSLCGEPLPVIEIIPPADAEFDYENKYNGRTQEICPPRSLSPEVQLAAQKLATRIERQLGVRDMSRTDMMVDAAGKLWVLETNTIPGLTTQSLLPKAAAAAGYTMPELCRKLIESALRRRG